MTAKYSLKRWVLLACADAEVRLVEAGWTVGEIWSPGGGIAHAWLGLVGMWPWVERWEAQYADGESSRSLGTVRRIVCAEMTDCSAHWCRLAYIGTRDTWTAARWQPRQWTGWGDEQQALAESIRARAHELAVQRAEV